MTRWYWQRCTCLRVGYTGALGTSRRARWAAELCHMCLWGRLMMVNRLPWLLHGQRQTQSTAHHTCRRSLTSSLVSCMLKTRTTRRPTPTSLKRLRTYLDRFVLVWRSLCRVPNKLLQEEEGPGGKALVPLKYMLLCKIMLNLVRACSICCPHPFLTWLIYFLSVAWRCYFTSYAQNGFKVCSTSWGGVHACCRACAPEPESSRFRKGVEGLQRWWVWNFIIPLS